MRDNEWLDLISSSARRVIDGLFLLDPATTSFGALMGVILHALSLTLAPVLQKVPNIDMSKVHWYHFVAFGAALSNAPALIEGRRELPKDVEDALEVIRRLEPSLSRTQVRMQRLALLADVVERANIAAGAGLTPQK